MVRQWSATDWNIRKVGIQMLSIAPSAPSPMIVKILVAATLWWV